jgi:hypothetical protein
MRGEAAHRKMLVACWRGSALAGYALLLERDSGSLAGLPVLDCIDVARDRDDPRLVGSLLRAVGDIARQRQIPLAIFRHFDGFIGSCCRNEGLFTRTGPPRRECARLPQAVGTAETYLTQFHGDFFV